MFLNILKILYYSGLVLTFLVFFYSLRTDEEGFKYTIYAIVIWAITYGLHLWMKKIRKDEENKK